MNFPAFFSPEDFHFHRFRLPRGVGIQQYVSSLEFTSNTFIPIRNITTVSSIVCLISCFISYFFNFQGLDNTLLGLNLAQNRLLSVPVDSLAPLVILQSLSLAYNSLKRLEVPFCFVDGILYWVMKRAPGLVSLARWITMASNILFLYVTTNARKATGW